jgi:hypothetical protein
MTWLRKPKATKGCKEEEEIIKHMTTFRQNIETHYIH